MGVGVTICRARFCDAMSKTHPAWHTPEVRPLLAECGLACCCRQKEAILGKGVFLCSTWVCYEGHCP